MEPTAGELAAITSIGAAMDWAGVPGSEYPGNAFLAVIGANGSEAPRLLGSMPEAEVSDHIDNVKDGQGTAASAIQRRGLVLAWNAAALACGAKATKAAASDAQVQATVAAAAAALAAQAPAAPGASPAAAASPGGVPTAGEFELVINQAMKGTIAALPKPELTAHFAKYKAVFGRNPLPNQECTPVQLGGLKCMLDGGGAPYLDFGVWGPNQHRLLRRMRFNGLRIGPNGTMQTVELLGPGDLASWQASYELAITGLLGFDAVDLGNLLVYSKKIARFHDLYGEACWAIIYQADVRARLEEMERVRREMEEAKAAGEGRPSGVATPFEPNRPWNAVWAAMADKRDSFWKEEVEQPSLLVLAKIHSLADHVEGDAPVPGRALSAGAASPPPQATGKRPRAAAPPPRQVAPRPAKQHQVAGGLHEVNRRGAKLCPGWQDGSCTETVRGVVCARDSSRVHQCAKCLDPKHGAAHPRECTAVPREPASFGAKGGGRGRGGGGGRGRGGGRRGSY